MMTEGITRTTSRESLVSSLSITGEWAVGDRCRIDVRTGSIVFIGPTHFAPGQWIGVVLDQPEGKNDGCVDGRRYFKCEPKYGLFCKANKLERLLLSPTPNSSSHIANPYAAQYGFDIGDRVIASGGKLGTLRYIGPTEFQDGIWAGIELDQPLGKNDGSVQNKRYFTCKTPYGLFALASKVTRAPDQTPPKYKVKHTKTSALRQRWGSRESISSIGGASIASSQFSRSNLARLPQRPIVISSSVGQSELIKSLQESLREKEKHIEQLMRERDMERSEAAESKTLRYASSIESAGTSVDDNVRTDEWVKTKAKYEMEIDNLRSQLKAKFEECEQLAFNLEEEKLRAAGLDETSNGSIKKIDGSVSSAVNTDRIESDDSLKEQHVIAEEEVNELRRELQSVNARNSELTNTVNELEVEADKYRIELAELMNRIAKTEQDSKSAEQIRTLSKEDTETRKANEQSTTKVSESGNKSKTPTASESAEDNGINTKDAVLQEKDMIIADLSLKITSLERSMEKMRVDWDAIMNENQEYKKRDAERQSEMDKITSRNATLETNVTDMQKRMHISLTELDEAKSILHGKVEEVEKLKKKIEILLSDKAATEAENKKVITENSELESKISTVTEELTLSKRALDETKKVLESSLSEIQALKLENQTLSSAKDEARSEFERLKESNEAVESVSTALSSCLKSRNEEIGCLKVQLSNATECLQRTDTEVKKLLSERDELERKYAEERRSLSMKVDMLSEDKVTLQEELGELSNKLIATELAKTKVETVLESYKMEVQEAFVKVDELSTAKKNLEEELDHMKLCKLQFDGDLSAAKISLAGHTQEIEELKSKLEEAEKEDARRRSELKQMALEKAVLQTKVSSMEEESAKEKQNFEDLIHQLKSERDKLLNERSAFTTKLDEKTDQTMQMQMIERMEADKISLSNRCEKLQKERDDIKAELTKLSSSKAELERALAESQSCLEIRSTELGEAKLKLSNGESMVKRTRKEMEEAATAKTVLEEKVISLEEVIKNSSKQISKLAKEIEEKEIELNNTRLSLAKAGEETEESARKMKAVAEQSNLIHEKYAGLVSEYDTMKKELTLTLSKKEEMEERYNALNSSQADRLVEINNLRQSLTSSQSVVESLRKELEHLSNEKTSLASELESSEHTNVEYSKQLEALTQELSRRNEETACLGTKLSQLKQELQSALERVKSLEIEKRLLNEKHITLTEEADCLKIKVNEADTKVNEMEIIISDQTSELQTLRAELSKTELENETIQELSAERMTEISTTLQKMNWLSQHIDRTLHTLFAEEESVTGIGKGANNKATSLKEVSDLGHPGANEGEVILAVDKLSLLQKNGAVMVEYIDRLMGSFTRILTELEASCNRENKLKNDLDCLNAEVKLLHELIEENDETSQKPDENALAAKGNLNIAARVDPSKLEKENNDLRERVFDLERERLENEIAVSQAKQHNALFQELEDEWQKKEKSYKAKIEELDSALSKSEGDKFDDFKSQIAFLNSIIAQNEKEKQRLKEQIDILNHQPAEETLLSISRLVKTEQYTRLYCDICEEFDKHDTTDCPAQETDPVDHVRKVTKKEPPLPRPYCDYCEAFVHDTADCPLKKSSAEYTF